MKNMMNVIVVVGLLIAVTAGVWYMAGNTAPDTASHDTAQAESSAEKKVPEKTLTVTKEDYELALSPDFSKTDPSLFLDPIPEGKPAPNFSTPTASGKSIQISDFKGKKNLVLVFYQGSFCSVCGAQLSNLQAHLADFKKYDTEIIAISADDMSHAQLTKGERGLSFHVVPDPDKAIIKKYGVKNVSRNIAWPSAYVVDKQGIVRLSHATENPKRLQSGDFLPVLEKITDNR